MVRPATPGASDSAPPGAGRTAPRPDRAAAGEALLPALAGEDALAEFPTEADTPPAQGQPGRPARAPRAPRRARPPVLPLLVLAVLIVVAAAAAAAWKWRAGGSAGPDAKPDTPTTGTLSIESTPAGARVLIDGQDRGQTPLALSLAAGSHRVVLQSGGGSRELTVSLAAGSHVVHHLELASPAPSSGRVNVPGPAGAAVSLDGAARGVAPIELANLAPGDHTVTVGSGDEAVTQRVSVPAGGVATFVVPPAASRSGAAPAWISIACAIPLEVFDGEALIGVSGNQRVLVLAGRHTFRLSNASLGYQTTRTLQVDPGRTTTIRVDLPNGSLSVNATPWAEVLLDGKRVGETPIANLGVPIGPHEITLRNPKFAEQKRSVVISLSAPTRVGVDLRQ